MRCYFQFVNSLETVLYPAGIETPDINTLEHLAQRAIQALREEADCANEEWRGWHLHVVDEAGGVLLAISLDTPLQ
jgi:hypothetical protein